MKVALVYPEVYDMARFREGRKEFPPFGVLYLGSASRAAGHDVVVVKATTGQVAFDFCDFDAVGFSLASSATYGLLLSVRRLSIFRSDCLVMAGGVHANFYPRETLLDFDADVVSVGEAERTILDLLQHATDQDFSTVPGVVWRTDDGTVRTNPARPVGRDISDLPLPARDLLPEQDLVMSDRLAGRPVAMAHVMFSRGCPFPCSFCAAGRTRIQYRNGVSARAELLHLIDRYGVGGFAIVDDNFIVNKAKVRDICDHIKDLDLSWTALSRVDTVDEPLLGAMAAAGCIEVKFGVESGSEALLRAMRKNTTQAQIEAAVDAANRVGIEAKAFLIHGYPGENLRTTEETMALLDRLGGRLSRVSLFRFVPLPGTQVYEQAPSNGVRGTHLGPDWDGDWEKFHIHHNDRHWWGSERDFAEMEEAYAGLRDFVEARWNKEG